jgi:hypothetical protein
MSDYNTFKEILTTTDDKTLFTAIQVSNEYNTKISNDKAFWTARINHVFNKYTAPRLIAKKPERLTWKHYYIEERLKPDIVIVDKHHKYFNKFLEIYFYNQVIDMIEEGIDIIFVKDTFCIVIDETKIYVYSFSSFFEVNFKIKTEWKFDDYASINLRYSFNGTHNSVLQVLYDGLNSHKELYNVLIDVYREKVNEIPKNLEYMEYITIEYNQQLKGFTYDAEQGFYFKE